MSAAKSVLHIYHDCLRSALHLAGFSSKGFLIRSLIRGEFRKHAGEENAEKIENLKKNAAAALANYLAMQNIAKVAKADNFIRKENSSPAHAQKEERLRELREKAAKLRENWAEKTKTNEAGGKK